MSGDRSSLPGTESAAETAPQADASSAASTRTLAIPLPTAIVAALITAMFGLLFFSLNGLRSDIDALRSEIGALRDDTTGQISALRSEIGALRDDTTGQISALRSEIGALRSDTTGQISELRAEIGMLRSDMDRRFAEINAVLLDHTDRLARIETHLDIRPGTDATDPVIQPAARRASTGDAADEMAVADLTEQPGVGQHIGHRTRLACATVGPQITT
ncbi:MAG: hypothetical protein F4155_02220 [Acidimicrobiales bacterium]|nr:hypothetical protein [Acidimicrobiales bacterium]MYH73592.1 hypothetical protein [Acidimicrobiales bacterium]MYK72374.1 hypothetical protein [Acidimicrobiales bacterium]